METIFDNSYITETDKKAVNLGIGSYGIYHLRFDGDSQSCITFMEQLANKYKIFQYNTDDYNNYDLFFNSNGQTENGEFTHFKLSTAIKTKESYAEILECIKNSDLPMQCHIQENVNYNKESITTYAKEFCERNNGKFVTMFNMFGSTVGKLKYTDRDGYMFFAKGASRRYTPLTEKEVFSLVERT